MNNLTEELKAQGFMTYLDFQDSLTDDEKDGKTTLFFEVVKPEDIYQKGYAEWVYSDWDEVAWDYKGREVAFFYRRLIPAAPNTGMIATQDWQNQSSNPIPDFDDGEGDLVIPAPYIGIRTDGEIIGICSVEDNNFYDQNGQDWCLWLLAKWMPTPNLQALKDMEGSHE